MGKSEQNAARGTAGSLATGAKIDETKNLFGGGAFGAGGLTGSTAAATGRQGETYDASKGGFAEGQKTGGYDPNVLPTLRTNTSTLADTGGYDPNNLDALRTTLNKNQPTGGFDPSNLDYLRGTGKGFVDTGGYDSGDLSSLRSGYNNFASTGGFTGQDEQNFRNRGTESVSATYNVLQDSLQRAKAATGGLGTGGDYSRMARQLGEDSAKASLNAETSLAEEKRAGKLAGLSGLGSLNNSVANNKMQALTGLGNLEGNVAAGGRDITGQQQTLETNVAGGKRAGVGAQLGLEGSIAGGRLSSNAGMAGLFNTSTGEISDIGNKILAQLGLTDLDQRTSAQLLQQLSMTPGLFDNIMRVGQVATGALVGAAGLKP